VLGELDRSDFALERSARTISKMANEADSLVPTYAFGIAALDDSFAIRARAERPFGALLARPDRYRKDGGRNVV
jgi:hypothetical protein